MSINTKLQQEYVSYYVDLHHQDALYGNGAHELMEYILPFIVELKPQSILDYGAGKSDFVMDISSYVNDCQGYKFDPAIKDIAVLPKDKVDLVINTDVMEHIPEENIEATLEKISRISQNVYFNICTTLSDEILPNGKNAHITIKPPEWWQKKIEKFFPAAYPVITRDRDCAFITWKVNNAYYEHINKQNKERLFFIKSMVNYQNYDNLIYESKKESLSKTIQQLLNTHPQCKIMLFGAGKLSQDILNSFDKKINSIVGLLDNNKEIQGTKILDYTVYSPESLNNIIVDYIIICMQNPEFIKDSLQIIVKHLPYKTQLL